MAIVESIFDIFGAVITNGVALIGDLLTSVLAFFWTTGETGGPTTLGVILLISVATPLILWGVNWVIRFVKSIRLK